METRSDLIAAMQNPVVVNAKDPIQLEFKEPTAYEVKAARKATGMRQDEAAKLVNVAVSQQFPGSTDFRSATWQRYESISSASCRPMPADTWQLYLLVTHQHPTYKLVKK